MIPDKLREGYVQVGVHIPPKSDELKSCFNEFENLFNQSIHSTHTMKLIYALCSHHRLTYIHPFYDGSGRVSRLYLDYLLFHTNIQGYGLWNISRGLARNQEDYRKFLAKADDQFAPYNDGRVPYIKPLPKNSNKLLEYLLIHGEVTRGEAVKVLDVSAPTANTIVKELLEEDYLETDSPRGKLKFKLNSKLSGYLIPDLFEK